MASGDLEHNALVAMMSDLFVNGRQAERVCQTLHVWNFDLWNIVNCLDHSRPYIRYLSITT